MPVLSSLHEYMAHHSAELGERILASYPPLHSPEDPLSPHISRLLRLPYPAQALAIMGVARRWQIARGAHVVAECGAGKTLIALGMMFVHAHGQPFSGIVMAPPHLVEKWARETFLTLPSVRVFLIDDMRNGGDPKQPHGVNEVRLRRGEIVREGLHTTLADMRKMGREGWRAVCPETSIFILGRERAKLGYFWKHAYLKARSGKHLGLVVKPGYSQADLHRRRVPRRAGLRQETPARDGREREERNDSSLAALAGRPQQDPAHGAGRLHGPLHARVVRLRHRR